MLVRNDTTETLFDEVMLILNIDFPHAGEVYSLASAVLWATSVILFKLSGDKVQPVPLNLYKNIVGLTLLLVTMCLIGKDFSPDTNTNLDWAILFVSGILGIGIADTLFFISLNNLGAGRFAIVDCLYSPFILLCSFVYLSEPIGPNMLTGLGLLISAILIGTWHRSSRSNAAPIEGKGIKVGVFLGILATFLMAVGLVMIKPVLNRSDPFWATMVRLLGGLSLLLIQGAFPRYRKEVIRILKPGPIWKIIFPAAVVGSYLAMFFWIAGMTYTYTTEASILNQTSVIFVIILATIILKEPLTMRKSIALFLGTAGALLAVL